MLTVQSESAQHVGQRSQQQDAACTLDAPPGFGPGALAAVVADGMGGMVGGAEASRVAVEAFAAHVRRQVPQEPAAEVLHRALTAAGAAVVQAARTAGAAGDMGTTFVGVLVEHGAFVWRTVGDSRLYLFRGGRLQQLNTEHTLAQRLRRSVDSGLLSLDEALAHPEARALTSFLGQEKVAEVDGPPAPLPLQPGDRLVLCSDGLHGTLSDDEIARRLAALPPGQTAQALVDDTLARARPHQDNVSVVVLTVQGAPGFEPLATLVRPALDAPPPHTERRPDAAPLTAPPAPPADVAATTSPVRDDPPVRPAAAAPRKRRAGWAMPVAIGALAAAAAGGYYAWVHRPPPSVPPAPVDSLAVDTLARDSLRPDTSFALPPIRTGADTLEAVPARRDSGAGSSAAVWPPPVVRRNAAAAPLQAAAQRLAPPAPAPTTPAASTPAVPASPDSTNAP